MMLLSRHIRKEAQNDNSYTRARWCYQYISSGIDFGHEKISHGPLFSSCSRRKRWTPWFTIMVSLLMVFDTSGTLRERFKAARDCLSSVYGNRRRVGRTFEGFCYARSSVKSEDRLALSAHLRKQLRIVAGDFWKRLGFEAFAVDGSKIELPRTRTNETAFGCAGRKKTCPQIAVTTLYHMGTGLPWDWRFGAGIESERAQLRDLLGSLKAGSLLVADAGFAGYELLQGIVGQGKHFLFRVGSNVTLLKNMGFDTKICGDVVWLWPRNKRKQEPLRLRLICVQTDKIPVYLITDMFDRELLSDETAAVLYKMRWGVEVFYRNFKRTLDKHKLKSRSPQMALDELHWAMTAYLLLGLMSIEGMITAGTDPLELSFAAALRQVRTAMQSRSCWRYNGDLRKLLAMASKDKYCRKYSRKARNWPHKKNDPPCGIPKIRAATLKESHYAQRFYSAA